MVKVKEHELGHPGGVQAIGYGNKKATYEVAPLELNFELQFPQNIPIYDAVRSQDGHVGSVLSAIILPVTNARWDLDTDGVKPEVVDMIRAQLGLPAPGEARKNKRRNGISWRDHIGQAIEAMLWAGFCPFEQVYSVEPAPPELEALGLKHVVHLRKLGQRLPRTIERIELESDGGLKAIHQTSLQSTADDVVIPVEHLVFYVNRREGADWSGRSILRQAYKHWLIKDVFLRLDAQAAERNSMGIPVIYYQNEGHRAMAEEAVASLRAGATAGLALPMECKLEIVGTTGTTVDLTPRIKYHDQEIARSALAMFLDLGQENGARSLGEVHLSVFMASVQAFADQMAETATEHIIRDIVELNFGPDEPYPTLTAGDLEANQGIAVTALKELVDAGIIEADDKLEAHMRARHGLPEKDHATARKAKVPAPAQGSFSIPAPEESPAPVPDDHDAAVAALLEQAIAMRSQGRAVKRVQ